MSRATTRKKHKRHWTTVIPANFEVRVRCCGKLHTLKLLPTGELIPLNHKGWDDDLDRVLVYSGEDLRCHKVLQSWRTIFKDKYISPEHKSILPKGKVDGLSLVTIAESFLRDVSFLRADYTRTIRLRRESKSSHAQMWIRKVKWVEGLWVQYWKWGIDNTYAIRELQFLLTRPEFSNRDVTTQIAEKNIANFVCVVVKKGMWKNTYLLSPPKLPPEDISKVDTLERVVVRNAVQVDDHLVCIYYRVKKAAYNPSYGGNSFSSMPFMGIAKLNEEGQWIITDCNYGV